MLKQVCDLDVNELFMFQDDRERVYIFVNNVYENKQLYHSEIIATAFFRNDTWNFYTVYDLQNCNPYAMVKVVKMKFE